jgi:CDP-diacylglycerol--glycerol-3-phosphate 3-phosphatidyltransferase
MTLAAVVLGYVHVQLLRHLGWHHPHGSNRVFATLGIANGVTLLRAWAVSMMAGAIALPAPSLTGGPRALAWGLAITYLCVGAADLVDGIIARKSRLESELGRHLDLEIDALGVLVASVLAYVHHRLPAAYLLVGLSYYLFSAGKWYRRRRGLPVHPLVFRPFARVTAGIQMVFVALALLPVFAVDAVHRAAYWFMCPLTVGFAWDWMVVSGRITLPIAERIRPLAAAFVEMLPVYLRIGVAVFAVPTAGHFNGYLPSLWYWVWTALWVMIVFGWLGRFAAIAAACFLAHVAAITGETPAMSAVFTFAIVMIVTGTGRWSMWRPEDRLMTERFGASPSQPPATELQPTGDRAHPGATEVLA